MASRVKGAGAVFGLAVLTTGCGDSGAAPTYTVRDSAGVRIVESTVPAWRGDEGWRLGTEPSLRIGVVDGPEELQFMRIVGARRLADGRIVVVDAGAAQVRFYDSAGRFIDAYGGQGSGPGEFRSISWAGPYRGDSLAVWDTGARRLTVIDLQSREGRMLQIEVPTRREAHGGTVWVQVPGSVSGAFEDGTLLVAPGLMMLVEPGEVYRPNFALVRFTADGEPIDTLVRVPGPEVRIPAPGAPRIDAPFARQFVSAIHGRRFHYGPGDAYEIRMYAPDGALERVIRATHRDLTLTAEDREAYSEEQRTRATDDAERVRIERALAGAEFPATLPPYHRMLVDAEQHVWVQDYRKPGEIGPARWSVFDPEGRLLGAVEMPERFQPRQIGADFILGIWTDELDVQYVLLHPLQRS